MKLKIIETPLEYMLDLNWTIEDLEKAKKLLNEWDKRTLSIYKEMKLSKLSIRVDMAEREHHRNCINFWEERLKNEIKST